MTIEVQDVALLRVFSESVFGTDYSASIASFADVAAREGSIELTLERISADPQSLVQSRLEYREEILGKRKATLKFTLNLAPSGTAASNGVTAVAPGGGLGVILKAVMGGQNLGVGDLASTGSTASVIVVTTAARWEAGYVMGWANSSGVVEWREVESRSGSNVTLKKAFSGSPANTNVLYNSAVYYFTEDPSESLQFAVYGAESDDRWLLMGGQCSGVQLALDPTGEEIPNLTFTFEFSHWKDSSETSSALTGTIPTASYSNYNPIFGQAGELRVATVGASTLLSTEIVHCSALAFDPKIAFAPVTSPSGANGGTVLRWRASRQAPACEGNWTTPYQDLTWFTARNSLTDKAVWLTLGQAAGSAIFLSAPTVQIVAPQRAPDASRIAAQTVAWKARRDSDVGASTTEIAKTPLRIASC